MSSRKKPLHTGMELWVTCAENDDCALDSLILGVSLARSMTNRNKIVLIGSSVSNSMRLRLENVFEGVKRIEQRGTPFESIDFKLFAKIYMWSMLFIKKAIFLDPSIFVLRNCDDLFDISGDFGALLMTEEEATGVKIPVLSVCPSTDIFDHISKMTFSGKTRETNDEGSLAEYLSQEKRFTSIESNLLFLIHTFGNVSRDMDVEDVAMVQFVGGRPNSSWISADAGGSFENRVQKYWHSLYTSCMLSSAKDDHMRGKTLQNQNEPIAIIGMSFRLPGANNIQEFWNLLINGSDAIRPVPDDRWTSEQCCIQSPEFRQVEAGFLNCPVDQFDGPFFGMSPMELSYTDPQHRLLLEIGWEALEDAAIDHTSLYGSHTGIFTGIWRNQYGELMTKSGYPATEFRAYMGNGIGVAGGRLAHVLGLTGSNIVVESACSSSMVAVGLACKSLRRNESDMALACGVNLILHPFTSEDFKSIVSPSGRCRTFDADADGFGRAEGCAVLVLKRLSQAVMDEDRIYAVIRGYGEVQEGPSSNMGTPTVTGESSAMTLALEDGNVDPLEVSYLEAHGTGTKVGDPIEMGAITKVYSKGRRQPLVVGAVKTNVGHTESVAGITGIIKTVLALQNELIPPHRNLEVLNPLIDLKKIPALIPFEPYPWKKTDSKTRIAGINSFGITGTDAHLILEETPVMQKVKTHDQKPPYNILTISAKSEQALTESISNYKNHFETNEFNLSDAAFTANTGRAHFNHRVAIVGRDCKDIVQKIQNFSFDRASTLTKPKICFLYTGQGSQHYGMGQTLYSLSPIFRKHFDKCDKILTDQYGISIKESLWGREGHKLKESLYSQTSIFCIEYALTKLWESWGITPDCVLGHSLGEFAASVAAEMLTIEGALKLVAERSRLINGLPQGKMLVVRSNEKRVEEIIKDFTSINKDLWLDIAAINSQDQTTVAGSPDCIEKFETFCFTNGLKTHLLKATHAFHSRDMIPILTEYKAILNSVSLSEAQPACKYISGVEGNQIKQFDSTYWVNHTRDKVEFKQASQHVYEKCGARIFLEIGPQPVLLALTRTNVEVNDEVKYLKSMTRNTDEWETIVNSLAKLYPSGFNINWKEYHKYHQKEKVALPFYPFQRKKYWFEPKTNLPSVQSASIESTCVHPLIGNLFCNATDNIIFESCIDLSRKEKYIKDHMVGKHVIFPGAGYLEMCIAAKFYKKGTNTSNPIAIENLLIKTPLGVTESNACSLQTVVKKSDQRGKTVTTVSINSNRDRGPNSNKSNNNWTCHASAEFSSEVPNVPKTNIELNEIKNQLSEIKIPDFYQKLKKLGCNFGPKFCTIKRFWKNESLTEILSEITVPEETLNNLYLTHPVAIDAMIQTHLFSEKTIESLHLPVSVRQFIWISNSGPGSTINFVHICTKEDGEKIATLYTEKGKTLAVLKGLQFLQTNLETLESKLAPSQFYPPIYKEKWRPTESLPGIELNTSLINSIPKIRELVAPNETIYLREVQFLNVVIGLGILKSFREMGCTELLGDKLSSNYLLEKCKIASNFKMLLDRFLEMVWEDGYLSKNDDLTYTIRRAFPTLREIHEEISKNAAKITLLRSEWDLIYLCLENLTPILQGKLSPLPIIFIEADMKIHGDYYNKAETYVQLSKLLNQTSEHFFESIKNNSPVTELRILEIGAGTGSSTMELLQLLTKRGIKYRYTFTDISAAFFTNAKKQFSNYDNYMEYKTLNIEEDPLTQGFAPFQYDVIIAAHVLHATKDLVETCKNARILLKTYGVILLNEVFTPQRSLDTTFGLLHGYWRFSGDNVRKTHCLVDGTTWESVFSKSGFSNTKVTKFSWGGVIISEASEVFEQNVTVPNSNTLWIIISNEFEISTKLKEKLEKCGRNVFQFGTDNWKPLTNSRETIVEGIIYIVKDDNIIKPDHINVCKHFLTFIQSLVNNENLPKLFVITEGQVSVADQEPRSPSGGAALWAMARTLRSEHPTMFCRCIDIDPNTSVDKESINQIFNELWNNDKEFQVAYRQNSTRHLARLVSIDLPTDTSLKVPHGRFLLKFSSSNNISDLKFEILPKLEKLTGNQIEVQVKACGLNFRDIFVVLKPNEHFNAVNVIGLDFSGVVTSVGPNVTRTKIGDAVIGINHLLAMPSHVKLLEDEVVPLPDNMTFAEGATFPVAFLTAYLCLVTYDQLKSGETVLIHTGSGSVGIVVIQIAQHIGAQIIATAGSHRKRAYLRSLGITHVFNSRNLEFGQKIKSLFPNGIDLVINSLTGPGFKETSLELCATNGRFVEMSILNILSKEEVKVIRPDVQYSIVDFTSRPEKVELFKMSLKKMKEYLDLGILQAVPHTRFPAANIREALNYFKKAEHIGKVICIMPEVSVGVQQLNLFNERSTYLITGGLGGIGIELAHWMTRLGAKHIVLCGRQNSSSSSSENISTAIANLTSAGAEIEIMQADVGDYNQCKTLIESIASLPFPPLRGIMHAAGALSDALVTNQTWDKFKIPLNAKMHGSWNLHSLTLQYNLEHFVLFSSMVATFGTCGQSNHAAANGFMDALAHYRHNLGLPATTINWGQWGEIGVAAHIHIPGMSTFTPKQAFNALEYAMSRNEVQISVGKMNISEWKGNFPWTRNYLSELKVNNPEMNPVQNHKGKLNSNQLSSTFWSELDSNSGALKDRQEVIGRHVASAVSAILKIDLNELEWNKNLQEMGLDSLMNIELRNCIQTLLGKRIKLSMTALADCNTISLSADRLLQLIYRNEEVDKINSQISRRQLIHKDSILPENIQGKGPWCTSSEIKTVLITGVTGNLGPYILENITNRKQIQKIYCLVRDHKSGEDGIKRLLKHLNATELLKTTVMSKVELVTGNITKENLGMDKSVYKKLVGCVDAVIHLAVKSNHLEEYRKTEGNDSDVRTVNVLGTLRILEFVTSLRTKWLFHASSLLAVMKCASDISNDESDTQNQLMPETWPHPNEFDNSANMGYAISKFIADRLIAQAVEERSIPCKVFRFPLICGDRLTGHQAVANNHFLIRYLHYIKSGFIPKLDIPMFLLPVNDCSDISLDIFFNDEAPVGLYNVSNPHSQREEDIVHLAKEYGRELTLVDYPDFVKKLVEDGEKSLLYFLQEFYTDDERHLKLLSEMTLLEAWRRNRDEFFQSRKCIQYADKKLMRRLEKSLDILKRDLNFALKSGFFTLD